MTQCQAKLRASISAELHQPSLRREPTCAPWSFRRITSDERKEQENQLRVHLPANEAGVFREKREQIQNFRENRRTAEGVQYRGIDPSCGDQYQIHDWPRNPRKRVKQG